MLESAVRTSAAALAAALACAAPAAQAIVTDRIFADGFESPIVLAPFLMKADSPCSALNSPPLHQGDSTRLCYRFSNTSADLAFTHQHVVDSTFGVTYDHDLTLLPGTDAIVESDLAPFPIEENDYHLATWTATGTPRTATIAQLLLFSYDPYVRLSAFLVDGAADCTQGIVAGPQFVSGLTAVTVAPGTPLAGCYRAQNAGITRLDHDRLVDDALGTLLDDTSTDFGQGDVWSVPRSVSTAATNAFSATWHAGFDDDDDETRSSATANITVVADPACHGIATSSTIDYGAQFSQTTNRSTTPDALAPAGMRLDLDASATPVRSSAAFTINAHGTLQTAASLFGPRSDTRIVLALPAGIDLARPLTVHATLGSGVPMTPIVDTGARTLTLHTGPLAGPPGDADITIGAYADAGTNALAFDAPSIELDMQVQGTAFTMTLVPEPAAPTMLVTPRCTAP